MQVNSMFATFFAFLTLVAPLATQAFIITPPSKPTTRNNTITVTREAADLIGPLTLSIARNLTNIATIAQDVNASTDASILVVVTMPANISGDGWQIVAINSSEAIVGRSQVFSVTDTSKASGAGMVGAIVGGVIAGVAGVSLIVFFVFLRVRRRRQQSPDLTFTLETGFSQPRSSSAHPRSSSVSSESEIDKIQWERQLEEQFSRARAMTPDVQRGPSPSRHPSPMPLAHLRAVTRN